MSNESSGHQPRRRSLLALDALNVFLADVRDGLGPYLAIYLTSRQHWDTGRVGVALSAVTIATVVAQTPMGGLIDRLRHKRSAIALAALAVAVGAIAMVRVPTFPVIVASQGLIGVAATVFAPAIAAISLGLVGHARLARRTGRNEAFNHGGNVAAAVLAGYIGDHVAIEGIFYLLAGMALATIAAAFLIRADDIDQDLARGAEHGEGHPAHISGAGELLSDRRVLVFLLAAALFHFANAAMLPLVGEKLTAGKGAGVSTLMSACIIAAQLVMVPVAVVAGRLAETWGRKPVFLIGFAVLPIRGLLYTLGTSPAFLVGVQLLDGIGAGIFGVVVVLVVADLSRGTGRFNLLRGAAATAEGLGASLSNLLAGVAAHRWGFDAGFVLLAATAAAALAFYWAAMPETLPRASQAGPIATPDLRPT